jgi:hypothetical protein
MWRPGRRSHRSIEESADSDAPNACAFVHAECLRSHISPCPQSRLQCDLHTRVLRDFISIRGGELVRCNLKRPSRAPHQSDSRCAQQSYGVSCRSSRPPPGRESRSAMSSTPAASPNFPSAPAQSLPAVPLYPAEFRRRRATHSRSTNRSRSSLPPFGRFMVGRVLGSGATRDHWRSAADVEARSSSTPINSRSGSAGSRRGPASANCAASWVRDARR